MQLHVSMVSNNVSFVYANAEGPIKNEGKYQENCERKTKMNVFFVISSSNSSAIDFMQCVDNMYRSSFNHRVYRLLYLIFQQIQLNLICCRWCLLIQHTKDLLQYQINSVRRYNFFYSVLKWILFLVISTKEKNNSTKTQKKSKRGRSFVIQASPFSWLFIYQFCYSLAYLSTIQLVRYSVNEFKYKCNYFCIFLLRS